MKDYRDRIKLLITRLYKPGDPKHFDVRTTTTDIHQELCTIIPANALDEFDIVEVMEEIGFEPQYEQKTEIIKNPDGKTETRIYDDLSYYWYLIKK